MICFTAETSITVDDVTHVIDSGLVKEQHYNPFTGVCALREVFISRSSAHQRAGRAGRVRPGHCWRLYHKEFYFGEHVRPEHLPEMQRIPLEEVVLQILLRSLGAPRDFLQRCIEPPSPMQLQDAIATLVEIKAVLPEASLPLTPLGYHLARLPMDVRLGKMLITACMLGCVEPVLTIAAALSGRNPLVAPVDCREQAQGAHQRLIVEVPGAPSDHLAIVVAYEKWRQAYESEGTTGALRVCKEFFLSHSAMLDIRALRELYRRHLSRAGLLLDGRKEEDWCDREGDEESLEEEVEAEGEEDGETSSGSEVAGRKSRGNRQERAMGAAPPSLEADLVRCALCAGNASQCSDQCAFPSLLLSSPSDLLLSLIHI